MILNLEEILKRDLKKKVIIFQTDTVYGLGTPIDNLDGVRKIYEIKKREAKKPLAVLCANIEQVKSIVLNFDDALTLTKQYWPGALTLVYIKNGTISDEITSGFNTVGVRIPDDPIALQLLELTGPMAVTSLNISAEPAVLNFADALAFIDEVDYIIKGNDLSGISSTVYDVKNCSVLRQGNIII
ncbi:MAG: L-threonylcarbamoyladenylate synthase [Candidatus Izemoplasma sp.]